jgi:hypothetical protein
MAELSAWTTVIAKDSVWDKFLTLVKKSKTLNELMFNAFNANCKEPP